MENVNQDSISVQQLDMTLTSTGLTPSTTPSALPNNLILGDNYNPAVSGGGSHLEQQQSLVKQKEAELKMMQNQIESYNQMVTQLTSQREMAVKRLTDMDAEIQELNKMLEVERLSVEAKDHELKSKRTKLQALKSEEDELVAKFKTTKQELDVAVASLTNTQASETQVQAKIAELKQFLAKTNSSLDEIEKAINYKDTFKLSALCEQQLKPPSPLTTNALLTNGLRFQESTTNSSGLNVQDPFGHDSNVDPFADNDPFDSEDNLFGFEGDQPLQIPKDDPFAPSQDGF